MPGSEDRHDTKSRLLLAEKIASMAQFNSEREALRVSESRYRRVFETAQDGILLLNAETAQIEDVNPYLIHMLGYSHSEFLGKKLWEVGPFADIKESKEMFLELQSKGYVRYEDLPLRTVSGVNIEVEFVSNSYDCDGIKIIQCNVRNITDRRITEKKLERHTQLYAALSQCNKAIVHCTSEAELFSQVCRAAVQFGGMKMAWIGLVDPKTKTVDPVASFGEGADYLSPLTLSIDPNSLHGGGPTCIAIRENRPYWCFDLQNDPATVPWRELIHRAGWAASASLPLRRNGVVIGAFILYSSVAKGFDELTGNLMVEMATDISFALDNFDHESQRKQAEEKIKQFEELINSSDDAIISKSVDGIITSWNSGAENVFGYSAEEVIGKSMNIVLPPDRLDEEKSILKRIIRNEKVEHFETTRRRKDGTIIDVSATISPILDHAGNIIGVSKIARNITKRKEIEAKLERHTQLYAALSQCNKATVYSDSDEELFWRICYAAVQFGGMKMAWVGLVDQESKLLIPVAQAGTGTDYLDGLQLSIDADNPTGLGPSATSIRKNLSVWCQDFLNDPSTMPWHERASRYGWGSSASLPLSRNGVIIGAFILYSDKINAFDELARALLTEMASDIGFALDTFEQKFQHKLANKNLHEAEERFRGLVEQSIAGICIIQDEKFIYANPRFAEILGLDSANVLIGRDPLSWIVETDRTDVARNIRRLLKDEVQSLALEFGVFHPDKGEITVSTNATRAIQGGKVAIIGVAQDISEKKRAEDEIQSYVKQLQSTLNGTIEVVEIISEMRDPYTAGHERRVAQISVAIAAELGLDAHQQEGLRVASILHDVGKIIIPAEILSKPTRLTSIEYALVQGHVQAGYDVLKNVKFPWPVALMVLQHHERMDGSGYPQGLKGESILLEARIITVADVVEAMSSHRPYRPGMSMDAALGEIERMKDVKYDPQVVDACLKLFRERGYNLTA
jgi:PAS domain S-box-containing protein